jgi:hypothetical protein
MMENPIGFTTFPRPPPTPLFPSDFLSFQKRLFMDFFEDYSRGPKGSLGGHILSIYFFPIFPTPVFSPIFGGLKASLYGIYYQYIFSLFSTLL